MNHPKQHDTSTNTTRGRAIKLAATLVILVVTAICSLNSQISRFLSNSILLFSNNYINNNNNNHNNANQQSSPRQRSLSLALPNGSCRVTYAQLSPQLIHPTWQASFPGSGSRMTWSLVEALTGIRTNDDYDSHERGFDRVVTIKTHYPVKDARHGFGKLDEALNGRPGGNGGREHHVKAGRAIVIVRNPVNAIPSYFNLQYEHLNHLPNHSTRGPNEDWLLYREHDFHGVFSQIKNFESFITYWMDRYNYEEHNRGDLLIDRRSHLLLVSYEDLTDDGLGPAVATRIADFLGTVDGVEPIARDSIPCVWHTIVKYKDVDMPDMPEHPPVLLRRRLEVEEGSMLAEGDAEGGRSFADPSSLRTGPKERPYTQQQLSEMVAMFQRLVNKYHHDEEFVRIMASYIDVVTNTQPADY